ncbi:Probable RNA-directed DNA polymerase from transposon BS [Eumeta japonica]|uniref:Probable RNA-directed DNA polymerase from transposon BS n=1 Tax=Eumeta variegata TaxID=151549 RepID=A0A4C1SFQ3_EUMVA|nr:Probable RNA-directed DNA polymerase from transposon BS [Eumeta japonica]
MLPKAMLRIGSRYPSDPITLDEVSKLIKGLKIRKSPGRDTISSKAIKCFSAPLVALLVAIFNACIQNCYFPTAWKEAVVIEYISEGFKIKRKTVAVFFDVAKAFDRVWHAGLIHKLYQLELPDRLVIIIHHYISNRHFSFRLDNTYSSVRPIRAGVPQGSTLSPLLYSAYVNDIPRPSSGVQLALFADDTALYLRSNCLRNILPRLQRAIDELTQWLRLWRIEVNPEKSASIYFNYNTRRSTVPVPIDTPSLKILNQSIPWQHNYKYLAPPGVTFRKLQSALQLHVTSYAEVSSKDTQSRADGISMPKWPRTDIDFDGCDQRTKCTRSRTFFGPFEPYSATDAVQDAQNKIEDSATELQRRHRSTAIQRRDHHRGIFSHHHHYDHDRNHHDRGQHRPHDDHRHVYRKHSETPQAHTDEPVPVAPTDSADAPRPSEKRKSTCNSRKRTHRIAKAKEELLRAQVQLAAARLAALETEETDSEEDDNTVVQDQETQKRVGNWVDTQMETLATIDAPHQKTERRGKTAEYRRARDRCQDRHATCSLRDLDTSRVRNRTEETDRNPDSGARNRNLAYTTFST